MRKTRILMAAATVAVTLTSSFVVASIRDTASAAVILADEFNGPAGSGVNPAVWSFDTGGSGNGNQELEFYRSGTANAAMDGQGHLVITARPEPANTTLRCWYGPCRFTSARIKTQGRIMPQFGHLEARMQIPGGLNANGQNIGQGIWPAFWMLGTNIGSVGWPACGEIDIMENVGRTPNTVQGTIHGSGYSGAGGIFGQRTIGQPLANAFHVYSIDWSSNQIVWRLDGVAYRTTTPAQIPRGTRWAFNHPFFVILNLAIGGGFPGNPNGATRMPAQMVIDYVRINSL